MSIDKKRIIGIIPARLGSTRLPGKPLFDICGKPLIQRVWESASTSKLLKRIIIATDDKRIMRACKAFNADCIMTPSELPSGTDRIMRAYDNLNENAGIVVNIQGDEPLLNGKIIDKMLKQFIISKTDVGTMISKIHSNSELQDNSIVKVKLNPDMTASAFSRIPIPQIEDLPIEEWINNATYWKHIGIYAYKIEALRKFVSLPVSDSEKKERLEQLRLLEIGAKYFCVETDVELIGVDTLEDLEKVRKIFTKQLR